MQLKSQFIGSCTGSHVLLLTLVLVLQILSIAAERTCYKCEGAECIEKSHRFVEKCSTDENICATIFAGETIQAKGCLNTIPEKFRQKCNGSDIDILGQCHKCNDDECNEWALSDLYCAQCDSRWNPECSIEEDSIMVKPTRCNLSRTPNLLCYALKKEKRIVRGCAATLEEQRTCMTSDGCYFCNPSIAPDCNRIIPALQDMAKPSKPPNSRPSPKPPTTDSNSPPTNSNSGSAFNTGVESYILVLIAYFFKNF
uniref:Putative conserved secreted protein n=1 Tax=Haematobia irritans TaxID=7368 RepID=A0A1L8EIZ8_HAEIR